MNYMAKRSLFILVVMTPCLLVAQYLEYDSVASAALFAGITSGLSVILFPDPKFVERQRKEAAERRQER